MVPGQAGDSSIIRIENLSKAYRLGRRRTRNETLIGSLLALARSPFDNLRDIRRLTSFTAEESKSVDLLWALNDVSFTVRQGEVLGIIGGNGAGKSTLLKILTGITYPTSGRAVLSGRVSSLLEVGTGFHPELSGRDNVFLNGTILGMTRQEIAAKFDAIVAFSGVEPFLDTPVKRYSSGMAVRLAFAVAAHLEPEILLIDEVLAVGDADFQRRCLGKMGEVARGGRTVLFVSHNLTAVKSICDRALWIDHGSVVATGDPVDIVHRYLRQESTQRMHRHWRQDDAPALNGVRLLRAEVVPEDPGRILVGEAITLRFEVERFVEGGFGLDTTFHLVDEMGHLVFVGSTVFEPELGPRTPGRFTFSARIPPHLMNEGTYTVSRFLILRERASVLLECRDLVRFEVVNPGTETLGWIGGKEGIVRPTIPWSVQPSTEHDP